MQATTNYKGDACFWEDLARESGGHIQWLIDRGVVFSGVGNYSGHADVDCMHEFEGRGVAVIAVLEHAALSCGVEILLESPAKDLLIADGVVKGVLVQHAGEVVQVACGAVVLATGGFQDNPGMLIEKGYGKDNSFAIGYGGHDGDGLRMAVSAGGFDNALARSHCSVQTYREWTGATPCSSLLFGVGDCGDYLWVNQDGERFCDESCGQKNLSFPANATFSQREAYSLVDRAFLEKYKAVEALALEVENDQYGDKYVANTLEELAQKAGINASILKKTVEEYNSYCDLGFDRKFGKDAESLTKISEPPFYLLRQAVMLLCTLGGIEVNRDMQVVDALKLPIEGLYAVGADSCQLYHSCYTLFFAGSANMNNIHSGRRAARHILSNR